MSSPEPDPQVVHAAIEEIRYLSGHNVIAAIGAQITELKAEMKAEFTKVNARIDAQTSRIESIESRINDLRQVIWRVIWPLLSLACSTGLSLPPLVRGGPLSRGCQRFPSRSCF